MVLKNINEPSYDTLQNKTVLHMKTIFSNSSAAAFRENRMNVTVFTQGNISIKPKSLEGRKGKLRRPEDTLVLNMRALINGMLLVTVLCLIPPLTYA